MGSILKQTARTMVVSLASCVLLVLATDRCLGKEEILEGNPFIKSLVREDFEPQDKVLIDQVKPGFWNLRIATWSGVPGDHMLNSSVAVHESDGAAAESRLPSLAFHPRLKGRYDILVGVRVVNAKTDFGLKLASEKDFTVISPPIGTEARHWNVEIPWKQNVTLDNETIIIKDIGSPNIYLNQFKFIPRIDKELRRVNAEHVVIAKKDGIHFAFPGVAQAKNGDLLVVCRESLTHATGGEYGKIALIRSKDFGETWEPRVTIYEKDGHDARDPAIVCMDDGTLVLSISGDSWLMRSTDDGYTWDAPTRCPVFSPAGPIHGPDGALYYCGLRLSGDGFWEGQQLGTRYVDIVRSTDHGKTWQDHCAPVIMCQPWSNMMKWEFYDEPALGFLPDGRWIVAHRVDLDGYLRMQVSDESGAPRTWTWPRKTSPPIWGHPPSLLPLADGSVLCTYGYRREPTGIRTVISYDRGQTWDVQHEIVLRDDGHGSDLGYPTSIQLTDGRIFSVYYMQTSKALPQIDGTFWRLSARD